MNSLGAAISPLAPGLRKEIAEAQESMDWLRGASGKDLFETACRDLHLDASEIVYPFPDGLTAMELGDWPHARLVASLKDVVPSGTGLADTLGDQIQLCRAFANPSAVTEGFKTLVVDVIRKFPTSADDVRLGHNPGDVLDPFILSANYELLSGRDLTLTIEATASHKVLMKIEDLLGNLHQTVLAAMRGNFRVPEPQGRGRDKETIHPVYNPFPGTDVGQVPSLDEPDRLRLFQVKSKTGSAKGGDGKRLGTQLRELEERYNARTFFAAVVGNTLKGHRSKGSVLRESPGTAVIVGQSALAELTQSAVGGELLLRLYERSFQSAAESVTYDFREVVQGITKVFQAEAEDHGDDFLSAWLHKAIDGPPENQDSRLQGRAP